MRSTTFILCFFLCISAYSRDLVPYRKGSKWGYADPTGKIIVTPIYSSVSHGPDEVSHIVSLNGKYGLLDGDGKKLTALIYDDMKFVHKNYGFIVTQKGKMGLIDNTGKILLPIVHAEVDDYPIREEVVYRDGNKLGVYSLKTKKVVREETLDEGPEMIVMEAPADEGDEATRIDLRYYVVRSGGKEMVGKESKTITFRGGSPTKVLITQDTLSFVFDRIIPLNYYKFPANLFQYEGKWGVIYNDSVVVNAKYDFISESVINNQCEVFYFQVQQDHKWGIVDVKGNELVKPAYDEIIHERRSSATGMTCYWTSLGIIVRNANHFGLVSINGDLLLPVSQDSLVYASNMSCNVYYQGDRAGVYGSDFRSGLIFSASDELSAFTKFYNKTYMTVIDSKRKIKNKWGYEEPFMYGYVNEAGVRFFEE